MIIFVNDYLWVELFKARLGYNPGLMRDLNSDLKT